ncbi:hypothetical protein PRIPAC_71816 [Pristionchus pacificus]|nr:hypothetical protein PRIPAC_71816 [Pristionchus pacificus]
MNHSVHSGYSNRSRQSRSKQPIYTSDKRARLTQRDNKKWLRLLTVFGYVVFVSAPAISLSVYYTCIWDPMYIEKFNATRQSPPAINLSPIKPKRSLDAIEAVLSPMEEKKCTCEEKPQSADEKTVKEPKKEMSLETLLKQHAAERDLSVSSEAELLSSSAEVKSSESHEKSAEIPPKVPPAGA